MKIFFEFSRSGLPKYLSSYETIRKVIKKTGNTLTRDLLAVTKNEDSLSKDIFNKINSAISDSSCVIIEGSNISMSLSYVLSRSIELGKPILFLFQQKSPDTNKTKFVEIIESKLLHVQMYKQDSELTSLIEKFLEETNEIKTRFNLVLNHDIDSFVTQQSYKLGVSKTKYITSLIEDKMSKVVNNVYP